MSFHGLIVPFFLALSNISLPGCTTISLSIYLLKGILDHFIVSLVFSDGRYSKQSPLLTSELSSDLSVNCLEKGALPPGHLSYAVLHF